MAGFSRRAKADIDGIWQYTVDHWGAEQAGLYLELIDAAIDTISADPKLGRSCSEIRRGYRKYLVGSHVVFYRMRDREVFIVRVLHQRMDAERHF
ncbi:MAG TPA: type II toxin-antitoxin system RelE/ParE family toxin [Reyranella sp.]|nr:type II toxin-antitoxin system RelE/ParE family toxin [Reyranella sp.]